jgi:hypothetical protein
VRGKIVAGSKILALESWEVRTAGKKVSGLISRFIGLKGKVMVSEYS